MTHAPRLALLASTIAASSIAACGHAVTRTPDAPAPHLRTAADDGEPDHTDPIPDPAAGSDVSLGGILAYADAHAPTLAVARSGRARADAARIAASPLLPGNPDLSIGVGPRFGEGVDVELSLLQPIAIAGERGVRLRAADRLRTLTDAEIEEVRWVVHCDVHAEFHRTLVEAARLALAERVVAFQEEVLRVVERQIAAGETAPLTLRLAQAEVAQARQVVVAAEQAVLASRLRLAQLAGWPITTPPVPAGQVDTPRDPPPLEQLATVARTRLPSLRARTARLREAEARVAVADREAWPRPSLGVQFRREAGDQPTHILLGVLSLSLPISDRNQGDRARAGADVTVARAEQTAAEQLLVARIAEARSAVDAAARRTRAYGTEILPRFEENLTLLRRSFELGEIDLLALSTGRERFLRIQSDALGAQLDYFVALAGLERVVGVDLWRDDHHQEPTP